ncbi:hypothetical protein KAM466_13640 [Aeromonas caviae]|nr:hypothetical protein KAM466_13640 [Aeromonas caviae]GKR31308.1 hypothetical protein KAM470_13810 [Aeromonas caviae]GKR81892.1 hypothetical protein KAM482_11030 [Aeromonas caviae]
MLRSELMTTAPQRVLHIPYHRVYPVECRMIQQIKVAPGDNTQVLTIGLLDRFETGQSIGYHRATTSKMPFCPISNLITHDPQPASRADMASEGLPRLHAPIQQTYS